MSRPRHRRHAALHRANLLLGLDRGESVVAWADAIIASEADPPHDLLDLAMTPADDLSALRHALLPLAEPESAALVRAVLDRTGRDLASGRRSAADTVTVLAQIRHGLIPPGKLDRQIDHFHHEFLLATARVAGDPVAVGDRLTVWLARFGGAEQAWLDGPVDHLLEFDRADEASAFVAALSRYLASPASDLAEPAEVWAVALSEPVALFLTAAAWEGAARAFAPLPPAQTRPADDRPAAARRVLDSRDQRAMGRDEAALR